MLQNTAIGVAFQPWDAVRVVQGTISDDVVGQSLAISIFQLREGCSVIGRHLEEFSAKGSS